MIIHENTVHLSNNPGQNPSMRAVAKLLLARAIEHSSNFCEQFEQRPNFARTFKLNKTIRRIPLTLYIPQAEVHELSTNQCSKEGIGHFLGSISAALSCPVYVPPRKESSGEERGLVSRTAAGNRA